MKPLQTHNTPGTSDDSRSIRPSDLSAFVPQLIPNWIAEAPDARHRSIFGTLVVAQLLGPCTMYRRLVARLGPRAVPELTDHLDAVFNRLADKAHGLGGTILKMQGDSLLVFFWGREHPRRAARAAIAMRSSLERLGPISTSGGEIAFDLSIGMHVGDVDFFLTGSSHKELFVSGRVTSDSLRLADRASPGEIRVSPALADLLPENCVDGSDPSPTLVDAPGIDRFAVLPDWLDWPVGSMPRRFVPEALRNLPPAGEIAKDQHTIFRGLIHLSNLDELIVEVGAETAAQHLEDLTVHIQRVFATHGVAFMSADAREWGPRIVCAAGAPRAYGCDGERLQAALDEITDYPSPIRLRVRIERGNGFGADVGPSSGRTFVMFAEFADFYPQTSAT